MKTINLLIPMAAANYARTIELRNRLKIGTDSWEAINKIANTLIPSNMNPEETNQFNKLVDFHLSR